MFGCAAAQDEFRAKRSLVDRRCVGDITGSSFANFPEQELARYLSDFTRGQTDSRQIHLTVGRIAIADDRYVPRKDQTKAQGHIEGASAKPCAPGNKGCRPAGVGPEVFESLGRKVHARLAKPYQVGWNGSSRQPECVFEASKTITAGRKLRRAADIGDAFVA